MKVGLSWDPGDAAPAARGWRGIVDEMTRADALGFDSAWLAEGRASASSCSQPSIFLAFVARRTKSIHLRPLHRRALGEHPVRLAEEIALLDHFSHGRAGIAFAAASAQRADVELVHETIEFVRTAWVTNEFRFRGKCFRFPERTSATAPAGASYPTWEGDYVPQWKWGAAKSTADFLAVTPKPLAVHVPVYVAIDDDATLECAARCGISPYVSVGSTTDEAKRRLAKYRSLADAAGRKSHEVDAVIERNVAIDGPADDYTFGGSTHDIACKIREFAAVTRVRHFVWRYRSPGPADMERFANEVQVKLQA
jgi:alkanesulfonate monooxygenase SsuD/methylene tetrahydromethanopterin reductase-like flavin-dependent oxidoreductase (luciferase family)